MILWLDNITNQNQSQVGNKAFNLAILKQAGFAVPNGFVLAKEAFEQWHETAIPTHIQQEILAAFDKLDVDTVAVRSSASNEDSATASWAGQFESVLQVTRDNLISAILTCWHSALSERSKTYGQTKSCPTTKPSMAVLIQAMVPSETAGVAFSMHPIHGTSNIVIEAVSGLGEKLVSGQVTPEQFIVDKKNTHCLQSPSFPLTLAPHEVEELTAIITQVEQLFGYPVDVEWAKADTTFWLVQSRPITTEQTNIADRTLRPTVKRDLSLFSVQAWQKGYGPYFESAYQHSHRALFYYDGKKVNFYPILSDFTHFKKVIIPRVITDRKLFDRLNRNFKEQILSLKAVREISQENIAIIFETIAQAMSFYMIVVGDAFVEAVPEAWESRHLSEGILYELDEKVEHFLVIKLRQSGINPQLAHVLSFTEANLLLNNQSLDTETISSRLTGYILENDTLHNQANFAAFCGHRNFINPEQTDVQSAFELSGQVAYPGIVTGKAKLVLSRNDISAVQEGDIIVCTMTNVNYYPAMVKAAGVITDEGGITCHAAIAVRELQKPCIVGTKVALQVITDGEQITLDAIQGKVFKSVRS